jgi:hypothetical protein
MCILRCAGASPKIPEIFPKIPDFPETLGKSPEYPGFTNKIVLSGDFQDSPIQPPPSRRHQDPFTIHGAVVEKLRRFQTFCPIRCLEIEASQRKDRSVVQDSTKFEVKVMIEI